MENPASLKEQFTFAQTDSKQSEYHDVSNISLSFRKKAWLKLKSNKAAMISLTFLVLIALLSVISLFWLPHNPNAQNVNESNLKPFTNSAYLLGTDNLGRDMLSRLLYGTRISLMIALFGHSTSFENGLLSVVNEGGDADTNGAIACAILGARFGYSSLPSHYINNLYKQTEYHQIITSFVNLILNEKELIM